MKLTIVSNNAGEIIATYQPTTGKGDAPTVGWIIPLEGHLVHEVDVPDNLAKPESIIKLHDTHLVEVFGKTATLVKREAFRK